MVLKCRENVYSCRENRFSTCFPRVLYMDNTLIISSAVENVEM